MNIIKSLYPNKRMRRNILVGISITINKLWLYPDYSHFPVSAGLRMSLGRAIILLGIGGESSKKPNILDKLVETMGAKPVESMTRKFPGLVCPMVKIVKNRVWTDR